VSADACDIMDGCTYRGVKRETQSVVYFYVKKGISKSVVTFYDIKNEFLGCVPVQSHYKKFKITSRIILIEKLWK